MYDAEKEMFKANAECLLQSSSTDAVLDVGIDPLSDKVIVTQTDAITIFDGLVVDSKPTVNSGSSEKGSLWGDLRVEQNSANTYVTAPAVDQRQVNEMVRGLANDSTAKLPNPRLVLAVPALVKSERLLAFASFVAMLVVIVVAKLASSFIAAASSLSVSKAPGAESINPDISESTYALIDC